jgi:ATP/ADP translocase
MIISLSRAGAMAMREYDGAFLRVIGAAVLSALVAMFGWYVAGWTGAAIISVVVALFSWYVGGFIARFAHERKRLAIRILICVSSLVVWLVLGGVVQGLAYIL